MLLSLNFRCWRRAYANHVEEVYHDYAGLNGLKWLWVRRGHRFCRPVFGLATKRRSSVRRGGCCNSGNGGKLLGMSMLSCP